jgi:hypothetical protein
MLLCCVALVVRGARNTYASTRATTTRTLKKPFDHVTSLHTFDDAASRRSWGASAASRVAGSSSARMPGTTAFVAYSCGGNERARGISDCFTLPARSSRSSKLDGLFDRAFAVLMELVRIAASSLASRISAAISAPCISSGSASRNHYSDSRISLRATAILWMKSARLSPPRASS